jgi:acyl carrier protein
MDGLSEDRLMTFDEFVSYLADALDLTGVSISPETTLHDDLDLDSLQMQELGLVMYELGAEVIEEMIPTIETLADLYNLYHTRVSAEYSSARYPRFGFDDD